MPGRGRSTGRDPARVERPALPACRGETIRRGASSMGAHAMLLALADLDPRGSQLDQTFEHVGRRARGGRVRARALPRPRVLPNNIRR